MALPFKGRGLSLDQVQQNVEYLERSRSRSVLRSTLPEAVAATAAPSNYRFAVATNVLEIDTAFVTRDTATVSTFIVVKPGVYRISTLVLMTAASAAGVRMEAAVQANGANLRNSRQAATNELQSSHMISVERRFIAGETFAVQAAAGGSAFQGSDTRYSSLDVDFVRP